MPNSHKLSEIARRIVATEIAAIEQTASRLEITLSAAIDLLMGISGKIVLTGIGKSGLIGQKLAATFSSTGTPAIFMNAAEALHGDLGVVTENDAVVMISNSGSTLELIKMVPVLREREVPILGLIGRSASYLADNSDVFVDVSVKAEACHLGLAPTSSTTAVLVVGDVLACTVSELRGYSTDQFARNHMGGALGRRLTLRAADIMKKNGAVPVCSPRCNLKEAAIEMTRAPLGAVCICNDDGRLVGIFTDGDLRRCLLSGRDLQSSVVESMTTDPICGRANMTLDELLHEMQAPQRKAYCIPIVDHELRLQGLVRMHDILSGD